MTWFKVDDGLHSHPKWLAASSRARALWATAGSWCAAHLTDGHVPRHVIAALGGRHRDAAELARLGLWEDAPGGWRFHAWDEFQPSSASVEAERASARERQRRARDKARDSRRDARRDIDVTDGVSHGPPRHGPPDPTRSVETKSSSGLTSGADPPDDDDQATPPGNPGTEAGASSTATSLDQARRDPKTETALAILAQRDLNERQANPQLAPIADVNRWLAKAHEARRQRHAIALAEARRLHPDWAPDQLADRIDPPRQTQPGTPLDGQQEAMIATAHQGTDHMRAIVHEPPPDETEQARVRSVIDGVRQRVRRTHQEDQ